MHRATPQMRNLAKRLVTDEARGNKRNKSFAAKTPADLNVNKELRRNLVILMGNTGFCALLSRALALTKAEVSWLGAVQVKEDGTLEGVEELHAQLDSDELFEGRVVLLAQLLGLLMAFIGESLTLRLVREVWPKALLDDLDFVNGEKSEKRKYADQTPTAPKSHEQAS